MFEIAVLIGIYSYTIFFLGVFALLYKSFILFFTVLFLFSILLVSLKRNAITIVLHSIVVLLKRLKKGYWIDFLKWVIVERIKRNRIVTFIIFLLSLQLIVNLIGALGPELAFDALWYHLTIPKIYLLNHRMFFITGRLLYYSVMPKLTEMLYVAALSIGNEITAKFVHFIFGILVLIALYKLSRKFLSGTISLLVVIIFYSNLVADWESITAYIDLARTFFELMALWGFVDWWEKGERKRLILSAVMLGFAISAKLLAIGSLFIFTFLILYRHIIVNKCGQVGQLAKDIPVYWYTSIVAVSPWFIFSFLNSGNPVYPFFSNIYNVKITPAFFNPFSIIQDIWTLFNHAADPISPVYIAFLPLIVYPFKGLKKEIKVIALYSFLSLAVWYFTPRTGGGRFILPYLPAFSILAGVALQKISNEKGFDLFKIVCLGFVIVISIVSIFYRGIANLRYLPVILGKETKSEFLTKNLNFSFGDFYDIDNYFKTHIKPTDKVLLIGFHNLYYVDFPFIDSSWVKKRDKFNYIATKSTNLPKRFKGLKLVYSKKTTGVKLYSTGGKEWLY